MNAQTLLLAVLRLLHIVSAVGWIALSASLVMFILPSAVAASETGFRYLKGLFTRTAYARAIAPFAGTTTLAGILLYLVGGGRFGPLGSAVLGIGALAGLAATIHGGAIVGRSTTAFVKSLASLPEDGGAIAAATLTDLNTQATKLLGEARISLALMIVALVCMGSARYI
jgi:hypothetical protein